MPTYEYECSSCGKRHDVFQSMSDLPLTTCPSCGQRVKRRIHGGTGVIFKGQGFYKNDSRKSSSTSCENCPKKDPIPAGDSSKKEAV
jgi:putative FmdB family regulatory protein